MGIGSKLFGNAGLVHRIAGLNDLALACTAADGLKNAALLWGWEGLGPAE